jgi:hypothetical protein
MNKQQIIDQLQKNYTDFTGYIKSLKEEDFLFTIHDKWTPGQQAEHILRSVKPVKLAFTVPKFLLWFFFGKANRPSRTYEQLLEKYKQKLAAGGRASGRFIPMPVAFEAKEKICNEILAVNTVLCKKVNNCTEEELESYILPHPLLGKLTLREMLYFNILHAEHHRNSVAMLLHSRALA